MYIVKIKNGSTITPIHDSKEKLTSGKITKGINAIDSFQFTMLPSNFGFDSIYDYTTLVTVYNTNRQRYEFHGRVLYSEDTMSEDGSIKKEVICESFLGFLCDSQQEYVVEKNWTVGGLLQHIVNKHNSQMESYKQFTIGEVTVTDPNDNIYCGIQRENTWETLKKKLIDELGGEIRFRVDGDVIYLDYLAEIGEKSSTEIVLSRNMKSISREKDPSEIVTRLIPLGYKLTTTNSEGQKVETEYRLDITSVNDGKNYIDDELAIATYGIRVATVEFDDVTVASTLLKKGEAWLIENNKIAVSYTITAVDLSLIGLDADDFEVCNYYVVKNPLLGIDDTIRVIKKSIDICDIVKTTLEFGDNFETLSESMKRHSDALGLITSNYVTNLRFESVIEKTTTLIEQTEEKIRFEVTADYSDLKRTTAELRLDVDGISSTVTETQGDINKLGERVTTAESKITQTQKEIALKVSQSEFDDLGVRVSMAEGQLALKIGRDENEQIVSMLNASADIIDMDSKRFDLHSESEYDDGHYVSKTSFQIYGSVIQSEVSEFVGTDAESKTVAQIQPGQIHAWSYLGGELRGHTTILGGSIANFGTPYETNCFEIMQVGLPESGAPIYSIMLNPDTMTLFVENDHIVSEDLYLGGFMVLEHLTNCEWDAVENRIERGYPFVTTITANEGCVLSSITVTMGGNDISDFVVRDGKVLIPAVTGEVIITANAD